MGQSYFNLHNGPMKNNIYISLAVVVAVTPLLTRAVIRYLYRNTTYATGGDTNRTAFDIFTQNIVREQTTAPRTFQSGELLNVTLQQTGTKTMLLASIFFFAFWILALWKEWGNLRVGESNAVFVAVLLFAIYMFLAAVPFMIYFRTKQFLTNGTLVSAKVLDVQYGSALNTMSKTIDAGKHGMAAGHVEFSAGTTMIQKPFEIDRSWAQEIRVGSNMLVLVNPNNSQKIFFIGME